MSERTFSPSGVPSQADGRHSASLANPVPPPGYSASASGMAGPMRISPQSTAAVPVLVAGLWVAISPWVLNLGGGNRTQIHDLIIGLAIAVAAMASLTAVRGISELGVAEVLGGIWLIVSAFVLAAGASLSSSWYVSNIISGIVVIVFGLAAAVPMRRKV